MSARRGVSINTTIYDTFRGADFSTDPALVDRRRSPYCTNMVADVGGMPEKRTGWRTLYTVGTGRVNGIWCGVFEDTVKYLAHVGTKFYTWQEDDEDLTELYSGAHDGRSQGVPLMGKIWIVTGGDYLVWDGETVRDVCSDGVAYAPTTVMSREPAGGGVPYEDINMIGRYRKNAFVATGSTSVYHLDATVDAEGEVTAEVNGEDWTDRIQSVNREAGTVTFSQNPPAPEAGQADNVVVSYPHSVEGYADRIRACSVITAYGVNATNRVFIGGCSDPKYANVDWASGIYNPAYIPDLSYSTVGLEGVPIRGYCRLGAYLAVVKAEHPQDSSVFIRSAELDGEGNAVFPLRAALAGVGAVNTSGFSQLMEEPVFLSGSGVIALTTSVYTSERLAQNRSYYINGALLQEDLSEAAAVQWQSMYLLAIGNGHVYVLDARQPKSYRSDNQSDYSYEGYFWADIPAVCWMTRNDGTLEHLFFGTADGRICRMNNDIKGSAQYADDDAPIRAVWGTKVDNDGDASVLKTMIKRGASVTIKPHAHTSAKVYVIKDGDTERLAAEGHLAIFDFADMDFSDFSFETEDGPHDVMLHTKVKKYKRLQILVVNDTPWQGFGIFAITKHYVHGNFAKK